MPKVGRSVFPVLEVIVISGYPSSLVSWTGLFENCGQRFAKAKNRLSSGEFRNVPDPDKNTKKLASPPRSDFPGLGASMKSVTRATNQSLSGYIVSTVLLTRIRVTETNYRLITFFM